MMMKDDKRKVATIIVSKMGKKSGPAPQTSGAEVADADEMYMIADEIMEAIKNSDVRALKESMQAMIECCGNAEPKMDDDMEESEDSEMSEA